MHIRNTTNATLVINNRHTFSIRKSPRGVCPLELWKYKG